MATPPLSSVSTHHRAPPPWPPPKTSASPRTTFRCGVLAPPAAQVLVAPATAAPSSRSAKNPMPSRVRSSDVNLQIHRLCQTGDLAGALMLLGSAGGVDVDVRSYCAVVQLCGEERSLEAARSAHALVRAASGTGGVGSVLGKRLVLAYLKCGDLGGARTAFDETPPRVADVRVWTSLMSAYAKAGDFQEGISLFGQMQCCGVAPDAHAVTCVLKCAASLGSIAEGEVVHGLLEKLGIGEACAVANALIALYSRCGRMEDAVQVFDSIRPRDAISWNSMISGCFSNGWHDRAVDLFSEMWSEGVEISSVTVLSVLPSCAELGYELIGKVVHGYSIKSGLLWDLESVQSGIDDAVGSKLVFMYVKCGEMGSARRVFDAMSSKGNVHVWNLMMGGYAKAGEFQESLSLFEQMHELGITPDEHAISCLVKCVTCLSCVRDGLVAHGYLVKLGFGAQCAVCNALISFYARSNMIDDAVLVFDRMPHQDTISWNSMISGCTSNGLNSEAIELFVRMWMQGHELDSTTLLSVLPACARSHHWFVGRVVHGYLVKTGLIGEAPLANALLDMYSNCSDWHSTNQIFRSMAQKNVVSWTVMITSYTRAGLFDKVAGLLQEMVLDGIKPDVFAVTSALHGFAGDESLKQGKSVHGYAIRNGMEKLLPVANALMEMYVKCRNLEEAQLVFDHLTNKDIISWNTLIGGYSRNNFANESFSLYIPRDLCLDRSAWKTAIDVPEP